MVVALLQRVAWRKRCVRALGLESIEGKDVEGDGGEGRKGEVRRVAREEVWKVGEGR
jgi:hypothetical protein